MHSVWSTLQQAAEEHPEEVSEAKDLYPHASELIVGAIAFAILFVFMWKWVLPQMNAILEERRRRIQGQMEEAEATRSEAERLLQEYRSQLAGAREEANRIIEEARETAEQLRQGLQAKAEEQAQATVARAQDEIAHERERAFQDLRTQVGTIAVELAERVVGQSIDKAAHDRLIDEFLDEVASGNGSSNGRQKDEGGE